MAIDTSSINLADMEASERAIVTLFEGSGIDYAEGSAARELLIRPFAALAAWQQAEYSRLLRSLDIGAIARGEVDGDDTIVDLIASTYRLSRRTGGVSTGSIILYLKEAETTHINAGYSFFVGGAPLSLSRIYVAVPDVTAYASTDEVAYTPILQSDGEHYMVIPVTDRSGGSYPTGTPVSFTGSIRNVSRAVVLSPIAGGGGAETNRSLASRILYGIAPGVLSTPVQLRGAFMDVFGVHPQRVRVFGSGEAAVRRAKDALTSLPLPGYTDIVVAPTGGPSVDLIDVVATAGAGNLYQVLLDETLASGIYSVDGVTPGAGSVVPGTLSVSWGTAPTRHKLPDGRYTAYQTATITFECDAGTSTLACTVMVKRARGIDVMQRYIDDEGRRAPGQDMVVRAAVPCMVAASLSVSSAGPSATEIRAAIAEGINGLPTGTGGLSAQDIISMLPAGVTLRFPLVLRGRFILPSGVRTISSTQGILTTPDWPERDGGITSEETAFFTDIDSIGVTIG